MKQAHQLAAIIEREGDSYVALCAELDIASQGETVEAARRDLVEAVELFLETADPQELGSRLHAEVFVPWLEVEVRSMGVLSCDWKSFERAVSLGPTRASYDGNLVYLAWVGSTIW